jgi:hypothetical protein
MDRVLLGERRMVIDEMLRCVSRSRSHWAGRGAGGAARRCRVGEPARANSSVNQIAVPTDGWGPSCASSTIERPAPMTVRCPGVVDVPVPVRHPGVWRTGRLGADGLEQAGLLGEWFGGWCWCVVRRGAGAWWSIAPVGRGSGWWTCPGRGLSVGAVVGVPGGAVWSVPGEVSLVVDGEVPVAFVDEVMMCLT